MALLGHFSALPYLGGLSLQIGRMVKAWKKAGLTRVANDCAERIEAAPGQFSSGQ